ncbi:MAG: precorrin-3B C(17)-methyltransferase [Planctomycetaceae bacterium]|nr:precorrin-3B C(17)-methyltransferase [Planctomycetaceae bacterium]
MNDSTRSPGTLFVVGLGPGSPGLLTPDAASALDAADVVVGYQGYLDLIAPRLAGKEVIGRGLGQEVERARAALELAERGRTVALVSSGDAGVYGMGGVAWELAARRETDVEIVVVPGVTAACSAAARLGAPLAHDWACLSLSDLLTPWDVIARRAEAVARADFALVVYNPGSRTRTWQLAALAEVLLRHRDPRTPVGLVENAYRPGERVEVVRLSDLATATVSMFTTVVIGSSRTFLCRGRMVTPRIHEAKTAETGPSPDLPGPSPTEEVSGLERSPGERRRHSPGDAIMAESLAIIERELGPSPGDPAERAVVRRMIHASADFDYADRARFARGAIASAVAAFRAGAPVVADVEMLRAGIRGDLAGPLGVATVCGLSAIDGDAPALSSGLTRSAAGMRRAAELVGDGAVVAIGNAPTALMEALRMIEERGWRPACIVGIPVGFVGVEEAKGRLMGQDRVPFVTSLGRKGGTAVTAAAVNALLELAGGSR